MILRNIQLCKVVVRILNLRTFHNLIAHSDENTLNLFQSHSAQHALAAMFRAAADGRLNFVEETSEYARRAHLTKEAFTRHGFRIVYDHDLGEPVSDGFFYTIGYGSMSSAELLSELLLYGVCAISLTSTGSPDGGAVQPDALRLHPAGVFGGGRAAGASAGDGAGAVRPVRRDGGVYVCPCAGELGRAAAGAEAARL